MRTILSGFGVALLATTAIAAQSATVERETKIEVKDGEEITVTGCLERHPDATGAIGYQLTNVADKDGRVSSYLLVDEEDDLEERVGQLVEIRGEAADREDGRIRIETETKVERDDAPDSTTRTTEETTGDLRGIPILAVDDVRTIRPDCG
jgi:hypothetical protein